MLGNSLGPIKKVFIGTTDVATQIHEYTVGFRKCGVEVLSMKDHYNTAYDVSEVDYVIKKYKDLFPIAFLERCRMKNRFVQALANRWWKGVERFFLKKALRSCDLFVFMYTTFDWNFSDLEHIKRKGKKIIFLFCGNDVRSPEAMRQEFSEFGMPPFLYKTELNNRHFERRLKYLRMAELYADYIFAGPPSMQLALRPYEHFYIPFDLDMFKPRFDQRPVPLIVHAPSNSLVKGTVHVLSAVEKLRSEGLKFDFRLVENMPYKKALEVYASADVIIGQMFGPMSGKFEREALALGKVVLSSFKKDYLLAKQGAYLKPKNYIVDCPIVDITPETIVDELRRIISDKQTRKKLATAGRKYMENYHDGKRVCQQILDLFDASNERSDIVPEFFRNNYVETDREKLELLNKYTGIVRGTDWYRKIVRAGMREGLIF